MVLVRILAAALAFAMVCSAPGFAASKRKIAVLGDAAPGGGVFAGPSFGAGGPSAAGAGWIAFRAQVTEGGTTEQIVVQNVLSGDRSTVASLGQLVADDVGKFKAFLGRPTVNGNGDVAFVATLAPGPKTPKPSPTDPVPAGLFLKRAGSDVFVIVARSNDVTDAGRLDLSTPVGVTDDISAIDIPERTPALDDAGRVAFLSSTLTRGNLGGALFTWAPGGTPTPLRTIGEPFDDGTFDTLGPPVASPSGVLAFRGLVTGDTPHDGVFRVSGGDTRRVVTAPFTVPPFPGADVGVPQDVTDIDDVLSVNDAGDVAFTGGPLLDLSTTGGDDLVSGIFVHPAAAADTDQPILVTWPGQKIETLGRVTNTTLSPEFGSRQVAPAIAPDGTIVFHALMNGGAFGLLIRAAPPAYVPHEIVTLGGSLASATPIGGTYLGLVAAPALDANLGIVFPARVAGASSSEVMVYQPPEGTAVAVRIGDAVPGRGESGYFGGPPFFPPKLNDAGTVVFKSYVAHGSGLGIFRSRASQLEAVVRVGDAAPIPGAELPHFVDFPGDPSINAQGDVAFGGVLSDGRRGVFVARATGIAPVALVGDDFEDPERPQAQFRAVAPNPALDDSGTVVFRGTIDYPDPVFPLELDFVVEDGLFAAEPAAGMHVLVVSGQQSPSGLPFFKFRDPSTAAGHVAFRAPLGRTTAVHNGIFLVDPTDGLMPIAVEGQNLSAGLKLGEVSGRAAVDGSGSVAFLGKVFGGRSGLAVLRGVPGGVAPVALAGDKGPAGGTFRSFGRPALSDNGHLVFRGNFEPFSGGTAGFFLTTPDLGTRPYLVVGESASSDIGGHFTGLNQNVAVNSGDQMAFLGSITDGASRSGIFLASRAALAAGPIVVQLRPGGKKALSPRDRVRLRAVLKPGDTSDGMAPADEPITITLSDTARTLWTVTVPKNALEKRRAGFRPKGRKALPSALRGFSLKMGRDGSARVAATSGALDLTVSGAVALAPPLTLRLEIGDDSASVTAACQGKKRRLECAGA